MMEPPLFLSYKKATILKVKHKKKILSFPCLFFFLSCSGLPRTSNRSVTLSVWSEYPKIPGTRCACLRMTEEKIILSSPYFYSFLVIPVFFSSPLSFPYSFLLLCHSRAWHGNLKEMSGSRPDMTSCCQLDRNTGCGTNLCRNALLSACILWASALCLLMSGSSPNMT